MDWRAPFVEWEHVQNVDCLLAINNDARNEHTFLIETLLCGIIESALYAAIIKWSYLRFGVHLTIRQLEVCSLF